MKAHSATSRVLKCASEGPRVCSAFFNSGFLLERLRFDFSFDARFNFDLAKSLAFIGVEVGSGLSIVVNFCASCC